MLGFLDKNSGAEGQVEWERKQAAKAAKRKRAREKAKKKKR